MKEYQNALDFWNQAFASLKPEKVESAEIGCPFLEEQFKQLVSNNHTIIDYGCGSGWASFCFALLGAKVLGLDQAENSIKYATGVAKLSDLNNLKFVQGDEQTLKNIETNSFDGLFSCNVFDVIPLDVTREIFKELHRVVKQNGTIMISLNPYLTEAFKERTKMEEFAPNMYQKDGNMRALNLTKDEWINVFSEFFDFVTYHEFNFNGENTEFARRMFILTNKAD